MRRKWIPLPVAGILFITLSGFAIGQSIATTTALPQQDARLESPLPNAPQPLGSAAVQSGQPQPTSSNPINKTMDRTFTFLLSSGDSKYSTVLKPNQKVVPYTVGEKFTYSIRESVSPESFFVIFFSAGYNHLIDGNPHTGSDSAGFGERVGCIALRDTSEHIISDGILASAFHQDPRYYRMGPGNGFKRRLIHAAINTFITHSDRDQSIQPDYSGLLGRAAGSFLTMAYYPHVSATVPVAAGTFGYSIAGELAGNAFLEFWPDVVHHLRHDK